MARKKFFEDESEFAEIADDLNRGEKIVVTEQRTIERQPSSTTSPETASVAASTIPADPRYQEIEDDDRGGDEQPEDDSLFALIRTGPNVRTREDDSCRVAITRTPDEFRQKFKTPCTTRAYVGTFNEYPLSRSQSELFEEIRAAYGGGNYQVKLYIGGIQKRQLTQTIADIPEPAPIVAPAPAAATTTAAAAAETAATTTAAPNPYDPLKRMLEEHKLQQDLKNALFGDELAELKELRERDRERQTPTSNTPPELKILEFAANSKNEEIAKRAIDYVFSREDGDGSATGSGTSLLDVAKFVIDNKESVAGVLQTVVGGLLGAFTGGGAAAAPQPPALAYQQQQQHNAAAAVRNILQKPTAAPPAPAPHLPPAPNAAPVPRARRQQKQQQQQQQQTPLPEPPAPEQPPPPRSTFSRRKKEK